MNKKIEYDSLKNISLVRDELLLAAVETKNMKEYCQFMFSMLSSILKTDKACLNFCNLKNETLGEIKSW